ncbi:SEC-C metal-binding domain-containing protein [Uliginosibacterium sp. 31-16]|uniref:SEC-C metal-binding domain-containing protein n=1 Tax=Uliginosibacterium sp. 31-16 TaxID=3068315 RepID=UPI00273FCB1F|nr:SEC-C metal-binding domain-containing protein [Uliginosibacterium sp. 31-16]MDP5238964.1 SEC-C metal-binding domain-containing protein [Uliginosibacterium sp. 31-16]
MKKTAVFTMVYNESLFLPIWLQHYGSIFGLENCFVLDDGSNDGSTGDRRIRNLISKKRSEFDEDDRARLISSLHTELLADYEQVIYTDTDELIAVDPALGVDLAAYLATQDATHFTPVGFDVIHRAATEPDLVLTGKLFEQRSYLRFRKDYCKTLISRIPLRWSVGFHYASLPPNYDRNLYLFHLRAVDRESSRQRIAVLNQVRFSENSRRKSHGAHFLWSESDYLDHLYGTSDAVFAEALQTDPMELFSEENPCDSAQLVRIPQRFEQSIQLSPLQTESAGSDTRPREAHTALFERALRRAIASAPERKRNDPCPCGSGKKFKHCHGALA